MKATYAPDLGPRLCRDHGQTARRGRLRSRLCVSDPRGVQLLLNGPDPLYDGVTR